MNETNLINTIEKAIENKNNMPTKIYGDILGILSIK